MIREIDDTEVDSVFELMKSNMISYFSSRNESWCETNIRNHFMSKNGVLLESGGNLIACSFYEKIETRIHIHTLQVAPSHQNRTIGGKFFKWYLELASKIRADELTCSVYDLNPAFNMYLRLGFKESFRENGVVRLVLPLTRQ